MAKNAELKTKLNNEDPIAFLNTVENEKRRKDAFTILEVMKEITGEDPKMWGASIIGFGKHHFVYESGRELDWFVTGFSPRKTALTIYFMGVQEYPEFSEKLGKFKTGKGCLYIKKLEDIEMDVLKEMITTSINKIKTL